MELAPFNIRRTFQVAKASPGHFPLPFLISESQRTGRKVERQNLILQIFFNSERINNIFFYFGKRINSLKKFLSVHHRTVYLILIYILRMDLQSPEFSGTIKF
jgi:hypothetical protein